MRGSDKRMGELFSYVDLENRVPAKHPLRLIRRCGERDFGGAAGASAAGVLYDPVGATIDGTARLQPALPLVRRAWG
jgi:hypothetical protein